MVAGAFASSALITFCVVPCGSAQKTRSRPAFGQSMPSIADELGQREGRELRKHLAHLLPGPAVGGQQRKLDVRMAQQQPHQFRTGIAGGAEHPDLSFGLLRHWSILGSILHSQDDRIEAMARKNSKVPRSPIRRHGTITRDRTPAPERRGGDERLLVVCRHGRAI